jgi:Ca2+-binding EF-hand superfamily protein
MSRFLLVGLAVMFMLIGNLHATQDKVQPSKDDIPSLRSVTIVKIDAKKGEITVKYTEGKAKDQQKIFQLGSDVKFFDETGRIVNIDVVEVGSDALILAREGKLLEVRRPARAHPGYRLSDAVKVLIEMTDAERGCVEEVQRIYDMLRKLDTNKNGKIDLQELEAERDRIVIERVKGAFERLDTNKDGKITKMEAKGLLKEHFEKIDRNNDGFIEYQELLHAAKGKHAPKSPQTEKK